MCGVSFLYHPLGKGWSRRLQVGRFPPRSFIIFILSISLLHFPFFAGFLFRPNKELPLCVCIHKNSCTHLARVEREREGERDVWHVVSFQPSCIESGSSEGLNLRWAWVDQSQSATSPLGKASPDPDSHLSHDVGLHNPHALMSILFNLSNTCLLWRMRKFVGSMSTLYNFKLFKSNLPFIQGPRR